MQNVQQKTFIKGIKYKKRNHIKIKSNAKQSITPEIKTHATEVRKSFINIIRTNIYVIDQLNHSIT